MPGANLQRLLQLQRAAFEAEPYPSLQVRRDRLARVRALVRENEPALVQAIDADFGGRSPHETRLGELMVTANAARHASAHLRAWMRPRRAALALELLPGRGRILRQPLGVVGIISPWNYPFQLAFVPLVGALAAGNRAMLKPSELTPRTSALIGTLVARYFREDEVAVVEGDAEVGRAFSGLPFDRLFFTGSTAVGRQVAMAAAASLVPVTLELGGKSPALIDEDADLDVAIPRIVTGKFFNAGQTCIAPDYLMVPESSRGRVVELLQASIAALYPRLGDNPDYTAIINARHYQRLERLVADARERGAQVIRVNPAGETLPRDARKLAPTLLTGVDDGMAVMQDEIFGPLLPIETWRTLDEAIARINRRPRPLAFYHFGRNASRRNRVLHGTHTGGVTVNDTLWHFADEGLPFGGIGPSGMGSYHGEHSMDTFSHRKGVFMQSRVSPAALLRPPYGAMFERLLRILGRL